MAYIVKFNRISSPSDHEEWTSYCLFSTHEKAHEYLLKLEYKLEDNWEEDIFNYENEETQKVKVYTSRDYEWNDTYAYIEEMDII